MAHRCVGGMLVPEEKEGCLYRDKKAEVMPYTKEEMEKLPSSITMNGKEILEEHIPRLIATIASRDAEIEKLKQDQAKNVNLLLEYQAGMAAGNIEGHRLQEEIEEKMQIIRNLKLETKCSACGCATPEDAEAKECGCDAPVCNINAPDSLAIAYEKSVAEIERLTKLVNGFKVKLRYTNDELNNIARNAKSIAEDNPDGKTARLNKEWLKVILRLCEQSKGD